jgi:hypothetical protein
MVDNPLYWVPNKLEIKKIFSNLRQRCLFIAENLINLVYFGNAIKDKLNIDILKEHFIENSLIKTDDLFEFYRSIDPTVLKNTVNWRIFEMVKKGVLSRRAPGRFIIGKSIQFKPTITPRMKKVYSLLQSKFPFVDYCIWEANLLKEFTHHQINIDYTIIEIERSSMESIYYQLRDNLSPLILEPSAKEFDYFLADSKPFYVIQPLITEAPIQKINELKTTTSEKLLVDVFCDDLWENIRGNELANVFTNSYSKYSINQSKLLRYASRKGRKDELLLFLKTNNLAIK